MTSEVHDLKTNEFLRRRKLRLQQVREQSKDIAKQIRQRAKVENLRQVIELNSKKQKDYLQRQAELVKKLEEYYADGVENVGASHRNASEVRLQEDQDNKVDLSKQRGKEAASLLRKKRQQILDKQKKLLDRKLQAREAANEISRDKSAAAINKFPPKAASQGTEEAQSRISVANSDKNCDTECGEKKDKDVARTDMATQWDLAEMPNEWEPNIPSLSLPKDDISGKESNINNVDSKSDKSKRPDLFAVSEEMPSSLRGGLINQEERLPVKSSLTLVSEYLQNRDLRLRETDTTRVNKKAEDLQSLKQTILRTRASKEVSGKGNIDKPFKSSTESSTIPKKSSVMLYNHVTRNSQDIPYHDERLVIRNLENIDDAYSQAVKESTSSQNEDKDYLKKVQEVRSKVAMTKQNVEKEYRDTISFLNALPKDKGNKPIKNAYMDGQRQQMQKQIRQQKLQHEYKKIEKECNKHTCRNKARKKPANESGDMFESSDFEYSWMPVPEGDGNLAVHTIPTTFKEGKSGNSVKFSKVDSYHEYRSRHKHTPPTKETPQEKHRNVEAVVMQNSSDTDSTSSEGSSESVRLEKKDKTVDNEKLSDAEKIIIYKVIDSKSNKKRKTSKLMKEMAKSLTLIEQKTNQDQNNRSNDREAKNNSENVVSFEQLNEGVYQAVNQNGDNIASMYFNEKEGEGIQKASDGTHVCPCTCKKTLTQDQQHRIASTSQQWISDDKNSNARVSSSHTPRCNCGDKSVSLKKNIQPDVQPSTGTSTASFKTATNDKTINSLTESNFIKLIDSGAVEAGKFYIGASGLLKNDAYEVIIQLRKKGDEKENPEDDKKQEEAFVKKSPVAGATQTSIADVETGANKTEAVVMASPEMKPPQEKKQTEPSSETGLSVESKILSDPSLTKTTMKDIPGSTVVINNDIIEPQVSGGVSRAIQVTNSQNYPKLCTTTTPRPATSTYTQTSMSSPNHRPVFLHMSSSTSTAYMSPPELIIPKFLREHQTHTDQEDAQKNYDIDDIEFTEQLEYSEDDSCRCKKCISDKKLKPTKHTNIKTAHRCRHYTRQNAGTPPNTVRSDHSTGELYYDRKNKEIPPHSSKKSKHKCRKCLSHNRVHECHDSLCHIKPRNSAAVKQSSRNLIMRITSSATSSNSQRSKRSKTNLKPIIKKYVDKLLVLNEQTLNAVQVINQDCSSVTTPGSSIIDVPGNTEQNNPALKNKLSLQQMQSVLKQKIKNDIEKIYQKTDDINSQNIKMYSKKYMGKNIKPPRLPRKKTAHKVKSLNISKKMSANKNTCETQQHYITKKDCVKQQISPTASRSKLRSKSSPTPRLTPKPDTTDRSVKSDLTHSKINSRKITSQIAKYESRSTNTNERQSKPRKVSNSSNHAVSSTSTDSENDPSLLKRHKVEIPMSISTQTSINAEAEMNFIELAEDKLQNMEKIADLTEKCTKRLSNLAKVLEEVRRNKTLAYSHISTSDATSDSDQKSDKNVNTISMLQAPLNDTSKRSGSKSPELPKTDTLKDDDTNDYIPFLSNIPKPVTFKNLNSDVGINSSSGPSKKSKSPSPVHECVDQLHKHKGKPPPALSRVHLKHGQDFVVPHELSTVLEVDSPMSVKLKSSRNDTKIDVPDSSNQINGISRDGQTGTRNEFNKEERKNNPDLLDSNVELSNGQLKMTTTESSDNSKIQMIDLRQFNEIMLKPFFSLQEYAKQCNVGALEDGSNVDDIVKDDQINDELSSLHSEASLPDVISELLKRNIITEPFKFDTGSNANSTTISSESTASVLALSKAKHGKNKTGLVLRNKENIGETSDSLSISSNPDLENAFKKLGLGWASSTLKKTKEHLALSSSSNTSSSSLSQFRIRTFNQEIPVLLTDTVSSVLNLSKNHLQRNAPDNSKNAGQQTSLTNSMTVKEILTNELAKKITFDKSRNKTEEEFVTLFETKMPEEMKHSSLMVREENYSIDNSMRSANNNRARTSTPVQLFKSMTYHSSSSSNMSNGLFSNADDLSSVKVTSNSMKHSTSDKDDLIIPNFSLRMKRGSSECSKSD